MVRQGTEMWVDDPEDRPCEVAPIGAKVNGPPPQNKLHGERRENLYSNVFINLYWSAVGGFSEQKRRTVGETGTKSIVEQRPE